MSLLTDASLLLTPNAYKEGKLYSVIPSNGNGDFTATRATTATRVNSAGLVDLVPYNLLRYSEQFENAVWTKQNATIDANVITAPDGILSADKLIANTTSGSHRIATALDNFNANHTFTIYAKKGELSFVQLALGQSINQYANFDVNLGVVGTKGSFCSSSSITSIADGWYRCTATFNQGLVPTAIVYLTNSASSDWGGLVNWSSVNNTDGLFIWGAQLVEGTSARDYLRTETRLNIPRIDYSLGSCPNILLEPQRTNVHINSQQMWNMGVFTLFGAVSPSSVQASINSPQGVNNAVIVTGANGSNGSWGIFQLISTIIPSGSQIAVSVFAKAGTHDKIYLSQANISATGLLAAFFDLSNGTTPTIGAKIEDYGNGWYRCYLPIITLTADTISLYNIGHYITPSTTSTIWTTNYNGKSVYFYGIQVEAGAYATSYIPTTTASVTRNADSITRNNIFTNGLITASGGTWFVELRNNIVRTRDNSSAGVGIGSTSGLSINALYIRQDTATGRNAILKRISGANTSLFTTTTDIAKIAIKWNGSTADVFQNGVKVVSATAFTPTVLEWIVCNSTDTPKFINEMALFPTPLTDAECIALTA